MKILLITHCFPPLNLAASLRPYSWAKYWSQNGAEICVLTTTKQPFNGALDLPVAPDVSQRIRIAEVPYWPFQPVSHSAWFDRPASNSRTVKLKGYLTRIRQEHTGLLADTRMFWVQPAVRYALDLYKTWPYDVIVSTYSPPATHMVASQLKRALDVTWVADYRDLWYGNHGLHATGIFAIVEKRLEDNVVRRADLITTVSNPLRDQLQARFGQKTVTIENGFDLEELEGWSSESCFPADGKVRLVYTGTIYDQYNTALLLKAVAVLGEKQPSLADDLEILFYSRELGGLVEEIRASQLQNIVHIQPYVNRKAILQIQRSANALLFFEWDDPDIDGILTSKLFEYFYSGRPIFSIGSEKKKMASLLIEESGTGLVLGNSMEKIVESIEALLQGRPIPYAPVLGYLGKYSRKLLAEKMLEEVTRVTSQHSGE